MKLIKAHSYEESIELIKNEILDFLRVRLCADYKGEGEYKGTNFDYSWTSGELMEIYVPSDNLTLEEIEEVTEYLEHYGYNDDHYNGFLKDWNAFDIVRKEIERAKIYDEDGTYRANALMRNCGILSDGWKAEILQVVTEHMIQYRKEDDDFEEFYMKCRLLTRDIIKKYEDTDCSVLGVCMWDVAEKYCDVYKDKYKDL